MSFDCYGTLIDWESGILAALRPMLRAHSVELSDARTLELYAAVESDVQKGAFVRYREVLWERVREGAQ